MRLPRRHRSPRIGRYSEPGSAPGTLRFDEEAAPSVIRAIGYGPEGTEEFEISGVEEIQALLGRWPVVWIDVTGLGRGDELGALVDLLKLHPLAMEDVVNLGQRAKVEPYGEELFLIGRMIDAPPPRTEQVSLFVGAGWVLTIQEHSGDPFSGVRARIGHGRGRIRKRGADYLMYALLDAIVDSYFPALDHIGDELEALEEEVLDSPDETTVARIHAIRRALVGIRKALGPHREAIHILLRGDSPLVTAETQIFLRDVYDHAIRSAELAETYREMSADLMSTYMSAISNRMNEVMKVLTIIATIFIPLGFIAGLYGMNFDRGISGWNMPELGWTFGYPFALALMLAVAIGFLVYMSRRGWLK